ncbi:hypothetical protein WT56_29750 [Burkholderia pseudomultivorans]|uniref:Uncharacterized protein n=1 Tax=Burkholderia pseudomultivorans TaxID=1207504 RepID=A0A132E7W1_9BURK|nr:hypothetical protein WT56_29750 [Burkholderia pseudomultivorans]
MLRKRELHIFLRLSRPKSTFRMLAKISKILHHESERMSMLEQYYAGDDSWKKFSNLFAKYKDLP